jgi:hypothetical protein
MIAPIIIFAFNRPQHLLKTLEALQRNSLAAQSDLIIYCDGPRSEAEGKLTEETRRVARQAIGFQSVDVVTSEDNQGLGGSIIRGVTEVVAAFDRAVVLEDDLITAPFFLEYMNTALDIYADNPRVASVHGYLFPHSVTCPPETFFLKGTDCLGWGTWKRAWNFFEPDAAKLLRQIGEASCVDDFNTQGCYDFTGLLADVAAKRNSSWAVRWHASAFLHDMYTLYPGRSLVFHAGSDGSGTNCGVHTLFDTCLSDTPIVVQPVEVRADPRMAEARRAILLRESGGRLGLLKARIRRRFPLLGAAWHALRGKKRRRLA